MSGIRERISILGLILTAAAVVGLVAGRIKDICSIQAPEPTVHPNQNESVIWMDALPVYWTETNGLHLQPNMRFGLRVDGTVVWRTIHEPE